MPWREVPAFFAKLKAEPESAASQALAFAILTAARSGEVMGAIWDEIDLDSATWTIPASRMKMGKEHSLPLSDAAVEILRSQAEARGRNPHVFRSRLPFKRLSINALSMAMERLGEGMWTVHGFRSSFRSWCADHAVAFEVAEACLAHSSSSVVEAYQRSSMLERRRPVMEAWAAHLGGETSANVVTFRAAG
jgi:integrase